VARDAPLLLFGDEEAGGVTEEIREGGVEDTEGGEESTDRACNCAIRFWLPAKRLCSRSSWLTRLRLMDEMEVEEDEEEYEEEEEDAAAEGEDSPVLAA
jgi:hypothetical protein